MIHCPAPIEEPSLSFTRRIYSDWEVFTTSDTWEDTFRTFNSMYPQSAYRVFLDTWRFFYLQKFPNT